MNPSFSIAHIRSLMPTFYDKAQIVRDIWLSSIPTATAEKNEKPKGTVNILDTLSRMALDIIGLTGFDYPFDALRNAGGKDGEYGNELAQAFGTVLNHPGGFGWWNIIINWFPILYNIVSNLNFLLDGSLTSALSAHSTRTPHPKCHRHPSPRRWSTDLPKEGGGHV